jgi:hypothetical protein
MEKKGVVIGIISLFIGVWLFTLAFAQESGLKVVNDPPTAEAINKFQNRMAEIGKECPQPQGKDLSAIMAASTECICSHLEEVQKANQDKINAFKDLVKRKPELMNEMVKIEGAFGNYVINEDTLNNKNTVESLKKEYNCK